MLPRYQNGATLINADKTSEYLWRLVNELEAQLAELTQEIAELKTEIEIIKGQM